MSNSLQVVNQNQDLTTQFSPKELELITHTIAKGATPEELQLFLYRCKLLNLNPMKPGQIFFIKYGQGPGSIVVGIEGFRSAAARTGKHVSTNRRAVRAEDGAIIYGTCTVKRRDQAGEVQEYSEETPFDEYYNDRNPSWKKMPETMIKKCAEAAALRMAYPDDLGGIYIFEEVERLEESQPIKGPWAEQPNADDGDAAAQAKKPYLIKFGSFAKRTIPEALKVFGLEKFQNAVNLTLDKLTKGETYKNVTTAEMKEFVDLAQREIELFVDDKLTFKSTESDVPF